MSRRGRGRRLGGASAGGPRRRPWRLRLLVWRLLLVAVGAWAAGFVIYAETLPSETPPDWRRTDAIVVLTGGADRLGVGLDLLDAGAAPRLFISGVDRRVDLPGLLKASGREAADYAGRVVLGFSAGDTVGNARETWGWAEAQGVRSIRLVTASYHLPRALIEFRRALPGVEILPHPVIPEHVKQDGWWRWPGTAALFLAEYQKFLVAWARDWLLRKLLPWPAGMVDEVGA
ncbi:YdcF family protein [Tistrella mobilis]|uniref:YdcF family protein n=1 Tax=Tistrella mobilis TaxID=171437 RepID=UPI001E300B04|nr:YdcF family protein [Tistrella mobilis]